MKSIIYIFNGRFPTERAHGIQIAKMCEAFMNAGIGVTLLVPYRRGFVSPDPFNYYGLKTQFTIRRVWGVDPAWLWNLSHRLGYYVQLFTSCLGIAWELLAYMHPDPETALYTRDYPTLILLAILGFRPIVEVHDYRLTRPSRFLAWAFGRARRIIVNSIGTQIALHRHYQISSDRFLVCPNGVDIDFFDIKLTPAEAKRRLGLPAEAFIVGYAGRLEVAGQGKGVDVLKRAFKLAQNHIPNAYLCIIGGDKSVPYSEIPFYLRAFNIAVLPLGTGSLARTTAPMKLFEYLAAGCAIVAADAPSLKEYLDDSTAAFFNLSNPGDLARVLISLAEDNHRRARLQEAAQAKAKFYTWSARAKKIINFLQ